MEVSGKKLMKDKDAKLCSFCEDFDLTTCADGFCVECEVYFCHPCFEKHKGRKISKNHTLVSVVESNSVKITADGTYDTCQQHKGEFVKFYCPKHDQVCCGECGVLNHNRCELKFIRDIVATLRRSQNSRNIKEEIARCKKEVEDSVSLLVINKQQLSELYEQFVRDVEAFADHAIERIQMMKNNVLNQAKEVMLKDRKQMDELQNQTDDIIAELISQTNLLETKNNQPNKLFVASLQVKSYLKKTKRNVDFVKQKNIVTQYKFRRDEEIAESIKESKVIGLLVEQSEKIQKHQHDFKQANSADETQFQDLLPRHEQSESRNKQIEKEVTETCTREGPMSAMMSQKPHPLLDRQLVCKNLDIDGECLSYTSYESSGVGLYVFNEIARYGKFFEIEIISMGKRGSLAIGLVPNGYPDNLLPGLGQKSYGYHSDGKVFKGSKSGDKCGNKWKVGDRIKVEIVLRFEVWYVRFTHNGKEIYEGYIHGSNHHFATGMERPGGKLRVTEVH